MKYTLSSLAFGLTSAGVLQTRQSASCAFGISVSGGVTGSLGQLADGQNRVGPGQSGAQYSMSCSGNGGSITQPGRGCILTPPTTQFQCDSGAVPTPGFTITSSGSIEYNGSSKFYACPADSNGNYNIYTSPVANQPKCVEVSLSSSNNNCQGYCTATGSGSGGSGGSGYPQSTSCPAPSYITSTITLPPSYITSTITLPPSYITSTLPPMTTTKTETSSITLPATTITSTKTETTSITLPAMTITSMKTETSSITLPAITVTSTKSETVTALGTTKTETLSVTLVAITVTSTKSETITAPGMTVTSTVTSLVQITNTYGQPTTIYETAAPVTVERIKTELFTAPAITITSIEEKTQVDTIFETAAPVTVETIQIVSVTATQGYTIVQTEAPVTIEITSVATQENTVPVYITVQRTESVPVYETAAPVTVQITENLPVYTTIVESAPAYSTPAASASAGSNGGYGSGSSSTCPADLSGEYLAPHLIIPVDSTNPNTAGGTSYFGQVSSTISSIFNVDSPADFAGKKCALIFTLPLQTQLQTSSFTTSGTGSVNFKQLSSPAGASTSYSNRPGVAKDFGNFTLVPGNSYTIATGNCVPSQSFSYEMSASGDYALRYFQDVNPCPIGVYIIVI